MVFHAGNMRFLTLCTSGTFNTPKTTSFLNMPRLNTEQRNRAIGRLQAGENLRQEEVPHSDHSSKGCVHVPQHIHRIPDIMMKGGKTTRALSIASPRMSRSKINPISARYPQNDRAELRNQETASFLEVMPLTAHDPQTAKNRKLENTYKMKPDKQFKPHEIEKVTESILQEQLHDKQYCSRDCKELSQDLSARILEAIKQIGYKRYKMVAVVSIGSMKERPGMQFGSRCLWNKETDNFISAKYSNLSLFAVAMVYGLYYD